MRKKNNIRVLVWLLFTSILVSMMAPVTAKAEVVENFTPRRVMIKREETEGAEDYSVSFFGAYEPAEETVITEGLTVMDAGMYDLYSLYFDQSVVAVEDDAPLHATGELVVDADRILAASGMDGLKEQGYAGYGVKVALFDTEVEADIPLAGVVSFLDEEQKLVEAEGMLHGTAVAAILSELVPMAELYSVEVLDEAGNGYYSSLIQGIYWAVENDMDVLVMSLGGESYSAFLWEALEFASWHDLVVLAAAGNEEGGSILYPAAYPEVLSVGAAEENGAPLLTYADGVVDLLAPRKVRLATENGSIIFQGSSAAAPVAASATVLLRSIAPELSREQVMALLMNTTEGVVDAEAAVEHRTSPIYTRLTNRSLTLSALEEMEAGLEGVLEALAKAHVCLFTTSYGGHSSGGHEITQSCSCGITRSLGTGSMPGCSLCYPPTPTPKPTTAPEPTKAPTAAPTKAPTAAPTAVPTTAPTNTPEPTKAPTAAPTKTPTAAPTKAPTAVPTQAPVVTPEPEPTETPEWPSYEPTSTPKPTPTPTPAYNYIIDDEWVLNKSLGSDTEETNTVTNGDPINMANGNFFLKITDMYFQGIGEAVIDISRSYNSVDSRSGLLGKGWKFAYESSLTKQSDGDIVIVYGDGRTLVFEKHGSSYLTPGACQDTLTKNSDGTWSLLTEDKLTYTYNSGGKLTVITDRNGNSVTFTYSGGSLSKITGADGIILTVSCSGGKLRKITDPFGRSVTYTYDSNGYLTKVSGETCGTMTFTYDDYGMTSITDGNGSTYIQNEYDEWGRVVRQTDEEGREYQIIYNDEKQENTFIVLDSGAVTRYQYDENLYITRVNYADGSYERFEYDDRGNRTLVRARSGYVTQYTYDADDNMTSVTDALGNVYTFEYDSNGNMRKAVSPLGSEVKFEFDTKGNLLKTLVLQGDGIWAETRYSYDSKGRMLSVTDAEGGKTAFTYADGCQPVSATNALGGTVKYTYDEIGRRTAIETDLGRTQYEYNSQDQITSITAPDGGVTKFVYDAIGNLTKLILPEQVEQAVEEGLSMEEAKGYTYTYDSMDRLIASGTPEDVITMLGYDMDGNVTEQSRPEYAGYTVEDEEFYRYTYDSVGNVIQVTAPDGGITTYDYDSAGNVIAITYPDGQESGASVKYTYDALGRVTSVTDTLGQTQYKYTYDADGNLTSVTDAMGYITWYSYTLNGLLTEARVPKKEENGQVWYQIYRYTYNKNGQTLRAESSAEFVTETDLPKVWDTVNYTYDAAGNVTAMKDSAGGEVQYSYNAHSQLLEQKVMNGVTDPVTTAYTYNNMGSIAEAEGYKYAYDLNGNLTKVNTPEGGEVRYFYDDADRLIRTEEDVQVDTLDVQDNSARIQLLDGNDSLYPKNSVMCELVVDLETTTKGMEAEVCYEDALLTLDICMALEDGVTADTSTPGVIKLSATQSMGKGESFLCYFIFTVKENVTGTAYVAVAPESTLTGYKGTFRFSECTGLLMDVTLPDYNGDKITDLRDFTLLAKQYGIDTDEETKQYDITGNGSVDDADLDYLKDLLFAGITEVEDLETDRVAEKTLQAAYTITSKKETRITTYEYNAADQVTKVTDCNGNSVYYDYDSCGRLVKMTDQAGYVKEIVYDTAGNPVKVVLPEGVTESYTYDTDGSLLTVTDALGAVTKYSYDAYGRTTSITDAVGVTTKYQYDIAGNVVKNLFTGEKYCYNAYDEVVSYTDAEGNVTSVKYDSQGNVEHTTDALGNATVYTYRKDGLLSEIKDASGAITRYEYDSKGLVSKETDALGAVTTYEYDSEDRPIKVTTPDGTITEYSYNTDGSVTKVTATKVNGEAEELRYLYALDGSLTASISSTDILEYTYDKRGYTESVTKNNAHVVSLVYDGNGNLTLLKELEAGKSTPNSITSYSYDSRGYLAEVYSGGTLTYKISGYDREGLSILRETAEDGELLASYISRADGLLEQTTDGAGNVTKYQYNQQKQVTGLTVTAKDGTVLYSEANTYNKNGSLLKQVISGTKYADETLSYTYDELNRLLSETNNGRTISYTYDVMGNRLTKTENGVTTSYVYDLCNKLLSETTSGVETTYTYDSLGNLTEKVSSAGTTTYAYNALNQLVEVVNPDGTWQSNTYDVSGIRSMIAENGVTTEFMSFNGLVLSAYSKDGAQTEHYYYGNSLLAAEYVTDSGNERVNANAETCLYYYLKNSHRDVIGLTHNTGTLTETYRYDAFGTLTDIQSLNESGVLINSETALSRFLYAGEQYDEVTELYYLRARQYDTIIGRFTQEDTYLGDGRNLYAYVSNNPLKYVDPSGHCSKVLGYESGNSSQTVNSPNEYVITYVGYPYDNPKNVFEQTSELYKAFRNDPARAMDDFCTGFFYEIARFVSFGLYHDPEAEEIRYEEAFYAGAVFTQNLAAYPQLVALEASGLGKGYYTPYYGNDGAGQQTGLVPTTNALTTAEGLNVIELPPSYSMQLLSTNALSSLTSAYPLLPANESGSDTTRVGRWMSQGEYDKMLSTGKVQMSGDNKVHVANPADINAFGKEAPKGSLYVEFDVPTNTISQGGKAGWGIINGPGSLLDRHYKRKGLPRITEMPNATNISIEGSK